MFLPWYSKTKHMSQTIHKGKPCGYVEFFNCKEKYRRWRKNDGVCISTIVIPTVMSVDEAMKYDEKDRYFQTVAILRIYKK